MKLYLTKNKVKTAIEKAFREKTLKIQQSLDDNTSYNCSYLYEDGTTCIIGACIPFTENNLLYGSIDDIVNVKCTHESGEEVEITMSNECLDMCYALQLAHDDLLGQRNQFYETAFINLLNNYGINHNNFQLECK